MAAVAFIELAAEIKADERGMSFFPWRDRLGEPLDLLKTFHLVSILPGRVRGNHLHPGHGEWLYPFHGTGVFRWETTPGEVQERRVSGGRTLIHVPPGVAHALKNPGPEILYLLAWREAAAPGSGEPETIPRNLDAKGNGQT